MSSGRDEFEGVNRWFCASAVAGYFATAVWPLAASAPFQQSAISAGLMFLGVGALVKGGIGFVRDYRLRQLRHSARFPSGAFGDARFASFEEMDRAGLFDPAGKMLLGLAKDVPAFLPGQLSIAIQAPPGAAKTSALAAAAVFHAAQLGHSVVVSDVKPELVFLWALELERRGFRVRYNNPAGIAGLPHHDTNPFAPLIEAMADEREWPGALTLAETFSHVITPENKGGKDRFWTNAERGASTCLLVCLAAFEPENCTPAGLWEALGDPRRCLDLLHEAKKSDVLWGDLRTMAAGLIEKERSNPEHFESHISGAAAAMSVFKPSSHLGKLGTRHDFDPKELRDPTRPPVIVFDMVPSDQVEVFGKANALIQTARLQSLKRFKEGRCVFIVADEATNLPIPSVVEEIELMRSANISIALLYQSWASLKRVYGEDKAAAIRANCAEMYFGVADYQTADELSRRIGERTIKTQSIGLSANTVQLPTTNVGESARRVMPPEDVLSMDRSEAILLVPGLRPVKLTKLPWYEVEPFKSLAGMNPNERHPKSPITRLALEYGVNAGQLGPPVVPDLAQRCAIARRAERRNRPTGPVPFLRARSFLWVPLVAAFLTVIEIVGTPHILFSYRGDARGNHTCAYLGLGGLQHTASRDPCAWLRFLNHSRGGVAMSLTPRSRAPPHPCSLFAPDPLVFASRSQCLMTTPFDPISSTPRNAPSTRRGTQHGSRWPAPFGIA